MSRTAAEVVAGRDLSGRTVLVTGATAGLGRETARALAGAGARVLLAGRDPERLEGASATVRAAVPGADPETVRLDLADCAVSGAARPYAVDPARARELWELSERLTRP